MSVVNFSITSMICQGCAEKISDILAVPDGVQAVSTNARKKLVRVEFYPDQTDEQTLANLLTDAGYEPEIIRR